MHFDYGPIILALAAAFAAWLKQRASKKPARRSEGDSTEEERTRRVQEEIRRKIAQRRAEGTAAPERVTREREAEPVGQQPEVEPVETSEAPETPIPPVDPFGGKDAWSKWRDRRPLAEPPVPAVSEPALATAVAPPISVPLDPRPTPSAAIGAPSPILAQPHPVVSPWVSELGGPGGLRKAVVWREILGPPVALRRPGQASLPVSG